MINAADSGQESTESDDEFQICEICNSEEVISFDLVMLWLPAILHMYYVFITPGEEEVAAMFLLWETRASFLSSSAYYRFSPGEVVMLFMQGENR